MNDEKSLIEALTDDTALSSRKELIENQVPVSPYSGITRNLTEDDLNDIAVKKLLLSENDKLERKVCSLEQIENAYHELKIENAVLKEKVKNNNAFEILYSSCLTIGSVITGLSSMFWDNNGYLILILGLGLIIGSIIAKLTKK